MRLGHYIEKEIKMEMDTIMLQNIGCPFNIHLTSPLPSYKSQFYSVFTLLHMARSFRERGTNSSFKLQEMGWQDLFKPIVVIPLLFPFGWGLSPVQPISLPRDFWEREKECNSPFLFVCCISLRCYLWMWSLGCVAIIWPGGYYYQLP